MRAYCDGCGRLRRVCITLNPRGSFKVLKNGAVVRPAEKHYCEDCGRIMVRRMTEFGLKG